MMKHYGTILTGKQNQPNLKQKHKKCVIIVRFIVYPRQYFEEIHRKIDCSKKLFTHYMVIITIITPRPNLCYVLLIYWSRVPSGRVGWFQPIKSEHFPEFSSKWTCWLATNILSRPYQFFITKFNNFIYPILSVCLFKI